jgi:hypothetical protein
VKQRSLLCFAIALAVNHHLVAPPLFKHYFEIARHVRYKTQSCYCIISFGHGIDHHTFAGFYPAMVLSRFNPVTALKSKLAAGKTKGISLRRGLVVFQFIVAQALIIGTLVIRKANGLFPQQAHGIR